MVFFRALALCLASAMICAAIRVQRPELATAVSLATGAAVLALVFSGLAGTAEIAEALNGLSVLEGAGSAVLKAAGIAVLAELGAQICADAGETALAGRIQLAARLATLSLCVPLLSSLREIVERLMA